MGNADVEVTAGEVDVFGGPLAQADFCGSWVGIFDADVVEGLLILRQGKMKSRGLYMIFTRGERKEWTDELLGETLRVGNGCRIGIIYSLL